MTKKSGGGEEITLQKNQALESNVEEVLVEGRSKQSDRDMTGRTRFNKVVNFEGDLNLIGELIPIRIVKAYAHSLRGEIVPNHCGMQNADCGMKSQNSPV